MRTWIWLLGIWLSTGGLALAEPIRFVLNPPVEKEGRLITRSARSVAGDSASAGPRYAEQVASEGRFVVTQESERRWLTVVLTGVTSGVNGTSTRHPMMLAVGRPIGFAFDGQGGLVGIRGLSAVAASAQETLGVTVPIERLDQQYAAFWDTTFGTQWGVLAGRRVALGSSWEHRREFQILGGLQIPAAGRWTFVGRQTPAADSPAILRYDYASETVPLGEGTSAIQAWLSTRVPELADDAWSSVTLSNKGELAVDPATLMIDEWTERTQLTLHAEGPSPLEQRIDMEFVVRTVR